MPGIGMGGALGAAAYHLTAVNRANITDAAHKGVADWEE